MAWLIKGAAIAIHQQLNQSGGEVQVHVHYQRLLQQLLPTGGRNLNANHGHDHGLLLEALQSLPLRHSEEENNPHPSLPTNCNANAILQASTCPLRGPPDVCAGYESIHVPTWLIKGAAIAVHQNLSSQSGREVQVHVHYQRLLEQLLPKNDARNAGLLLEALQSLPLRHSEETSHPSLPTNCNANAILQASTCPLRGPPDVCAGYESIHVPTLGRRFQETQLQLSQLQLQSQSQLVSRDPQEATGSEKALTEWAESWNTRVQTTCASLHVCQAYASLIGSVTSIQSSVSSATSTNTSTSSIQPLLNAVLVRLTTHERGLLDHSNESRLVNANSGLDSGDWFDSSLDADTALSLSNAVLRLVETFVIEDNASSSRSYETNDPFTRAEQRQARETADLDHIQTLSETVQLLAAAIVSCRETQPANGYGNNNHASMATQNHESFPRTAGTTPHEERAGVLACAPVAVAVAIKLAVAVASDPQEATGSSTEKALTEWAESWNTRVQTTCASLHVCQAYASLVGSVTSVSGTGTNSSSIQPLLNAVLVRLTTHERGLLDHSNESRLVNSNSGLDSGDWFDSSLDADTALSLSDAVLRLVETFVIEDTQRTASNNSLSSDPFTRAEQRQARETADLDHIQTLAETVQLLAAAIVSCREKQPANGYGNNNHTSIATQIESFPRTGGTAPHEERAGVLACALAHLLQNTGSERMALLSSLLCHTRDTTYGQVTNNHQKVGGDTAISQLMVDAAVYLSYLAGVGASVGVGGADPADKSYAVSLASRSALCAILDIMAAASSSDGDENNDPPSLEREDNSPHDLYQFQQGGSSKGRSGGYTHERNIVPSMFITKVFDSHYGSGNVSRLVSRLSSDNDHGHDDDVAWALIKIASCRSGAQLLMDAGVSSTLVLAHGNGATTSDYDTEAMDAVLDAASQQIPPPSNNVLGHVQLLTTLLTTLPRDYKLHRHAETFCRCSSIVTATEQLLRQYPRNATLLQALLSLMAQTGAVTAATTSSSNASVTAVTTHVPQPQPFRQSDALQRLLQRRILALTVQLSSSPLPPRLLGPLPKPIRLLENQQQSQHQQQSMQHPDTFSSWWDHVVLSADPGDGVISLPDPPSSMDAVQASFFLGESSGFRNRGDMNAKNHQQTTSSSPTHWTDVQYQNAIQSANCLNDMLSILQQSVEALLGVSVEGDGDGGAGVGAPNGSAFPQHEAHAPVSVSPMLQGLALAKALCRCSDVAKAIEMVLLRDADLDTNMNATTAAFNFGQNRMDPNAMNMNDGNTHGAGTATADRVLAKKRHIERYYLSLFGPILGRCCEKILVLALLHAQTLLRDGRRKNNPARVAGPGGGSTWKAAWDSSVHEFVSAMVPALEHTQITTKGISCVLLDSDDDAKTKISSSINHVNGHDGKEFGRRIARALKEEMKELTSKCGLPFL
eukprot:CAMPEP_0194395648 /NCGR_PEP_ID=MMETSP0174-20130528/124539_1 /TAXON_ID=216777 /ORGANISM="Proboscia alata, Strain PI-D3" /LENGTH=1428 /DNA_ID=CAMNT_0039191605 /DNA_START=27 /DNA_END=4314 /DNA_ORIENTATION=-